MSPDSIRTSIDLPRPLHRRLHEAAARQGCSARQFMIPAQHRTRSQKNPNRSGPAGGFSLQNPPLIPRAGRRIDLTNEQIYDLIEFP